MANKRWFGAATFLTLLLYIVVSVIGFRRSLLPDEIRPLLLAARSADELLALARADLVQTPLSYFVARTWLNIFGHTDLAAKLLPLTLGIASIGAFAFLARRATAAWLLALALFCASYLRIGSSLNLVRMYGFVVLFAVLALLAWDKWRQSGRNGWLAAWAAMMVLAIFSHPSALLLLGALTVATWLLGPKRLLFTVVAIVPLLSLAPWIAYVYPTFRERGMTANIEALADDPTRELARMPFYFLMGDPPGAAAPVEEYYKDPPRPRLLSLARRGALGLALVMAVTSLFWLRRRPWRSGRTSEDDWLITSLLLVVLPAAVLYGVSLATQPVVSARYLLVSLPSVMLLVAGLSRAGGRLGMVLGWGALAWILASAAFAARLNTRPAPPKAAAVWLNENLRPGDVIVAARHNPIGWQFHWEWTRRLGRTEQVHVLQSPNQPPWLRGILPGEEIAELPLAGVQRVWLLDAGARVRPEVEEGLAARGFAPGAAPVQDLHFVRLYEVSNR